jgi:hypothetical protein
MFCIDLFPSTSNRFLLIVHQPLISRCLALSDQSSNVLFRDEDFITSISNALSTGGVLVAQVGQAGRMNDAPREFARRSVLDVNLVSDLKSHRFVKVRQYSEGHGGLLGPWTFMVAFNDERTSERWFATEAEVALATRERMLSTDSGSPPLRYFDGSVMRSYAFPSRVAEENFCRTDPSPSLCRSGHGFDPELPSAPASSLLASRGSTDDGAGIGSAVFNESLNTYVAIEESVNDVTVLPKARRLIQAAASGVNGSALWDALAAFVVECGLATSCYGDPALFVRPGIAPARSVCNGTGGGKHSSQESSETPAPTVDWPLLSAAVYDPFVDRNHLVLLMTTAQTRRSVAVVDPRTDGVIRSLRRAAAHGNASDPH